MHQIMEGIEKKDMNDFPQKNAFPLKLLKNWKFERPPLRTCFNQISIDNKEYLNV